MHIRVHKLHSLTGAEPDHSHSALDVFLSSSVIHHNDTLSTTTSFIFTELKRLLGSFYNYIIKGWEASIPRILPLQTIPARFA